MIRTPNNNVRIVWSTGTLTSDMTDNGYQGRMDEMDLQAAREGRARAQVRDALPSVMGKRVEGTKHNYRKTSIATSRSNVIHAEKQRGFGAR